MNKPEMSFDHIAPTSDPLVVWGDHLYRQCFSALSSSWAFPQTPKVEESELGLKPKTSNTFDPDHIHCVYFQSGPEYLLSIWSITQSSYFQPSDFHFKENYRFFFFSLVLFQKSKVSKLKSKIRVSACYRAVLCWSVGGKRPLDKQPWDNSLSKQKALN